MKRYLSVFEMITRSSIYKVLLILIGMVAAELTMFCVTMQNPSGLNIEEYIDQSQYSLIFKIAYLLITVVIVLPGMNMGSVQSYTLQRLRIKEKRIFWLQFLYNLFAYVLLCGVQLIVILLSSVIYQNNLPEAATWSNQTLFLAFYRNNFMHSILPLEDVFGWLALAFLIVGTAMATADFTRQQRRNKLSFGFAVVLGAVLTAFPREFGYKGTVLIFATVCIVLYSLWRWTKNWEGESKS